MIWSVFEITFGWKCTFRLQKETKSHVMDPARQNTGKSSWSSYEILCHHMNNWQHLVANFDQVPRLGSVSYWESVCFNASMAMTSNYKIWRNRKIPPDKCFRSRETKALIHSKWFYMLFRRFDASSTCNRPNRSYPSFWFDQNGLHLDLNPGRRFKMREIKWEGITTIP